MHHLIYDMCFDTSRKRFINSSKLLYSYFSEKNVCWLTLIDCRIEWEKIHWLSYKNIEKETTEFI